MFLIFKIWTYRQDSRSSTDMTNRLYNFFYGLVNFLISAKWASFDFGPHTLFLGFGSCKFKNIRIDLCR